MSIVIDTSALLAILQQEPERDLFLQLIAGNEAHLSAGSMLELYRVARLRRASAGVAAAERLIEAMGIDVVPVDAGQVRLADEGQRRFGKGRGDPPAVLNFGDLFAYALARHLDAPLLFKGDDFSKTDVKPAMAG